MDERISDVFKPSNIQSHSMEHCYILCHGKSKDRAECDKDLLLSIQASSNTTPQPICQECMLNKFDGRIQGTLIQCTGPCKRIVHSQCMVQSIDVPTEVSAFKCVECTTNVRECFKCERKGNDLVKCPVPQCHMFFHRACLIGGSAFANPTTELVPCGHHKCWTCHINEREAKEEALLSKCILCPRAFHFNFMCFPIDAVVSTDNHGYCVCSEHVPDDEKPKEENSLRINLTTCLSCFDGGRLMICKSCPVTKHMECAGLDRIPEEDWCCHDCVRGKKPVWFDVVWNKFGDYRPWPCQIVPSCTLPPGLQAYGGYGWICLRVLGTNEYSFAQARDILPWESCDPNWKRLERTSKTFARGLTEAYTLYQDILRIKKDFLSSNFMGVMRFYRKIEVNQPVNPVRYGGKVATDYEFICDCKATDVDPCGPTSNCVNRHTHIECHPNFCFAGTKCSNQRIRKKLTPKLKVFYTAERGWGLMAEENIKKGDLVIEYCGEIITVEERKRRFREKLATGDINFYYLALTNNRVIDAGPAGNDARFANHSCDANTSSQKWMIDGETHIALIAIKDINRGDEITFDYCWEYESGVTLRECLCGAENCNGMIGGKRSRMRSTRSETGKDADSRPIKRPRKRKSSHH